MTKISIHPLNQPAPLPWSTAQLPWEIATKYIPQSWILDSNKRMLLPWWICQNEDPKSAVVVGLHHNLFYESPPLKMTEFLADCPDWHLGSWSFCHSLFYCGWMKRLFGTGTPWIQFLRIRCCRRRNWICKNVSRYTMRVPNAWQPIFAARLSIPPGIGRGGKDTSWLVTWECPLRTDSASFKTLESFIQLTSFCGSSILAVS